MGQVPAGQKHSTGSAPAAILLIGSGGLATTLAQVLSDRAKHSDQFTFRQWSRQCSSRLRDVLATFDATHVWLAISDRAIAEFATENRPLFSSRRVVHFSGALPSFDFVHAAHPLSTFSKGAAMSAEAFSHVPFILDREGPGLEELLPGFANLAFRLDPNQRAYYHALCAVSGNFTVLLWETVADRFESELGLPRTALDAYRARIFENLSESSGQSILTGPIARGDIATLQKHHDALLAKYEMPLLNIYDGFIDLYRTRRAPQKAQV